MVAPSIPSSTIRLSASTSSIPPPLISSAAKNTTAVAGDLSPAVSIALHLIICFPIGYVPSSVTPSHSKCTASPSGSVEVAVSVILEPGAILIVSGSLYIVGASGALLLIVTSTVYQSENLPYRSFARTFTYVVPIG